MKLTVIALLGLAAFATQSPAYRAEVDAFRAQREAEIGGRTGWAALTGLHWLTPGTLTIGRAAGNAVVLTAPSAPPALGTLTVTDRAVTLHVAPGVTALVNGRAVTEAALAPNGPMTGAVSVGAMTLVAIERGGRLALRVWDPASPARQAFHGLRWYAVDPAWRVEAVFTPHQPAPRIRIQNIIGQTLAMANPGVAAFTMGGRAYRLEALLESDDADELFFMFQDGTSGKTTYGAGRYLYTPLPKDGHVTIDFNRAMNPPCAFTNFATCPLPPSANRLSLAVAAGELDHERPR